MKSPSSGLVAQLCISVIAFLVIAVALTYYAAHIAMAPSPVRAVERVFP